MPRRSGSGCRRLRLRGCWLRSPGCDLSKSHSIGYYVPRLFGILDVARQRKRRAMPLPDLSTLHDRLRALRRNVLGVLQRDSAAMGARAVIDAAAAEAGLAEPASS